MKMATVIPDMSSSALRDTHAAMPVRGARLKSHPVALTMAQAPQLSEEVETEAVFEHSRNHHGSLPTALSQCTAHGACRTTSKLRIGHPAQQIRDDAREGRCRPFVLGHHGHGFVS
ncbi:MAG TPA: hypothetical protein VGI48_12385 [Caldimonas sp.]|jgi:hypothetical protein